MKQKMAQKMSHKEHKNGIGSVFPLVFSVAKKAVVVSLCL